MLVACPSQPKETSAPKDSQAPPCVDTFPVSVMPAVDPEQPHDLPSREDGLPELLSQTPLYADIASKEVHEAVHLFTPRFELWSDGAQKQRWVYLPECESINTSQVNDWKFPVGTRWFKEFTVDDVRIETRLIERIGEGPRDFAYASYLWNSDESEATRVSAQGVLSAKDTTHNIPSKTQCLQCHGSSPRGGGRPSRALGFSALQLNHEAEGMTMQGLLETDKLSTVPTKTLDVPGDDIAQTALGMLHANCGHCHNSSSDKVPHNDLNLWLDAGLESVQQTGAWTTAVNQPTTLFKDQHISGRIVPGHPDESALLYRMGQRGNNAQMPPLGTIYVDTEGVAALQAWIESLP